LKYKKLLKVADQLVESLISGRTVMAVTNLVIRNVIIHLCKVPISTNTRVIRAIEVMTSTRVLVLSMSIRRIFSQIRGLTYKYE